MTRSLGIDGSDSELASIAKLLIEWDAALLEGIDGHVGFSSGLIGDRPIGIPVGPTRYTRIRRMST